jgi:hypothetical protein
MKKFILMGTLALVAWSSVKADEPAPTGGTATGTSLTSMTSSVTPVIRKKGAAGPTYRKFEIRAGPRVMLLNGDVQIGNDSPTFDIWEDLGLDLPNAGAVFDIDWQPYNRFHVMLGVIYDNYDQKGTTTRNINTGSGPLNRVFASGSEVKANFHAFQFDGKLGWDVVRDQSYRLQLHGGLKGLFADGKLTITGSSFPGGIPVRDETRLSEGYVVGTVGLDNRVYLTRGVYLGLDTDFSAWIEYFGVNGDLYVGWDITKNWGVRAGYDFTYVGYENDNDRTSVYPFMNAFYFQAVWGF